VLFRSFFCPPPIQSLPSFSRCSFSFGLFFSFKLVRRDGPNLYVLVNSPDSLRCPPFVFLLFSSPERQRVVQSCASLRHLHSLDAVVLDRQFFPQHTQIVAFGHPSFPLRFPHLLTPPSLSSFFFLQTF